MNRFSIRIKLFYICLSGLGLFLMIYSRFNIKGIVELGTLKSGSHETLIMLEYSVFALVTDNGLKVIKEAIKSPGNGMSFQ